MSPDDDTDDAAERPAADRPDRRQRPDRDEPVLPDVTSDERGVGWGEDSGAYSDDWYRRERPPHHGD